MPHLKNFLERHLVVTFLLLGLSFGLFGLVSFNLIYLFKANLALFIDYGVMVIGDGALQQLVELVCYGYLGLAAYVLFKTCEHSLVDHFLAHPTPEYRD
jgi:hypothetical protein